MCIYSAKPIHGSQVLMWSFPVQCNAIWMGGSHAALHADKGKWDKEKWHWETRWIYLVKSCVFVSVQSIDLTLPCPLEVFEMLVVPEQRYPLVCVAVSKGSHPDQVVTFGTVDANAATPAFTEPGQYQSHCISLQNNYLLLWFAKRMFGTFRVLLLGLVWTLVVLCVFRNTSDMCHSRDSAGERHCPSVFRS